MFCKLQEQGYHEMHGREMQLFYKKWEHKNENAIRLFIQQSSQLPQLQVIDYMLLAVYRVYSARDFRFYRFMKEKISLVHDIFDVDRYPNNYYTKNNLITEDKIKDPSDG